MATGLVLVVKLEHLAPPGANLAPRLGKLMARLSQNHRPGQLNVALAVSVMARVTMSPLPDSVIDTATTIQIPWQEKCRRKRPDLLAGRTSKNLPFFYSDA